MFFIPEVLGRKGPLATVWLAAHLDRRITNRQIEETDLVQVVTMLLQSQTKFSLRIMADLVVGVATLLHRQMRHSVMEADNLVKALMIIAGPKSGSSRIDLPRHRLEADPATISLPDLPAILDIDYLESLLPTNLPPYPTVPRHTITLPEHEQLGEGNIRPDGSGSGEEDRLVDDTRPQEDFAPITFEELFGEPFPADLAVVPPQRIPFRIDALEPRAGAPRLSEDEDRGSPPPVPPVDQISPPLEDSAMPNRDSIPDTGRDASRPSVNLEFSLPPLDQSAIQDEYANRTRGRRARGRARRGARGGGQEAGRGGARGAGRGRGRRRRLPSPDALPDGFIRAQQTHRWQDVRLPEVILPPRRFQDLGDFLEEPARSLPGQLRGLFPRLANIIFHPEPEEEEEEEEVGEEERMEAQVFEHSVHVDPEVDVSTEQHPLPAVGEEFEANLPDVRVEPQDDNEAAENRVDPANASSPSISESRPVARGGDEDDEFLQFEAHFAGNLDEALIESEAVEFESLVPNRAQLAKAFFALIRTAHANPMIRIEQDECSEEELVRGEFKPITVLRNSLERQEVMSHRSVEI